MKIGICAPACPITPELAIRARAFAEARYGERVELVFHPQCFVRAGHFAGPDEARLEAFVELANAPELDAVWFARGGYGACRIAGEAVGRLEPAAADKTYLGYSDCGFLLAALARAGVGRQAHGPVVGDVARNGGEAAIGRALAWLADGDRQALEGGLDGRPAVAFNLTVLSHLVDTPLMPDLTGRVLMVEEVSEHHYAIDRALWHVLHSQASRGIAGLRLGRCTLVPENDPPFGIDEEAIARHWCGQTGVPFLGRADIGHDADNKIVPWS